MKKDSQCPVFLIFVTVQSDEVMNHTEQQAQIEELEKLAEKLLKQ